MDLCKTADGKTLVTLIPGDGIGPEVVESARKIVEASGAQVAWEERHAGARIFKEGLPSGVPEDTIESTKKTKVVLKGPLETPVGFGEKSANVTLRKLFETYANVRPVRELPGVETPFSGRNIDLVIVRENVEDLYAGIEYQLTPGVAQGLKLISRKGCEKIVRFAFEFARSEGRKSVVCATKANIMKLTEGLMKSTFEEIAPEYPEIDSWHIIIDNCAHQLVRTPEQFDVIVTTNMNGDILSDLTSGLVGGLGFAPSANIGNDVAIFEAVHGSAPKYAGKNVINPTSVIGASVMMLRHIGEFEAADKIDAAMLTTFEEGKTLTRDVVGDEAAAKTTEFTDAVIANLGKKPSNFAVRERQPIKLPNISTDPVLVEAKSREDVGVDVFVESPLKAQELGDSITELTASLQLKLKMIDNRGTKVYPSTGTITDFVDSYRCRFILDGGDKVTEEAVFELLKQISSKHSWVQVIHLKNFDGEPTFTKAQGED